MQKIVKIKINITLDDIFPQFVPIFRSGDFSDQFKRSVGPLEFDRENILCAAASRHCCFFDWLYLVFDAEPQKKSFKFYKAAHNHILHFSLIWSKIKCRIILFWIELIALI